MVDVEMVCCMCGDVGFSDKLFRCTKCHNRFQHSYCSNYYTGEAPEPAKQYCDWCQSEEIRSSSSSSSRIRSSYSSRHIIIHGSSSAGQGEMKKVKKNNDDDEIIKEKTTTTTPSPRPTARRYKLLKDVMSCPPNS